MPIIKVTQKDIARMNPPDAGTYLATVMEITESVSKDKTSTNYTINFEIKTAGPNEGRWISALANSKAPMMTLGPLLSAIYSIPKENLQPEDIDTDKLIGKMVGLVVIEDVYDGRIVKKIKEFLDPTKMTAPF